jgi:glycosyltransferase WbpL
VTVTTLLLVLIASHVISRAVQPALVRWARQRAIVAVPNARSSHASETPVGGGLPIAACAIAGVLALGLTDAWSEPWWPRYVMGALAVAAVSWVDDLRGAGTWPLLIVHGLAAGLVAQGILGGGASASSWPPIVAAMVGIIGVTNAYNFMDGVDGMAGATAVVAGAGWIWLGWMTTHPLVAGLGAILCGASLGFLSFNWQPARIFLGDVGAALLGFTFAVLPVVVWWEGWRVVLAGTLCLWPFLFDTTFTMLRRLGRGENVMQAHRSHLYQRLVRAGWTHARVSAVYAGLALAGWPMAALILAGPAASLVAVAASIASIAALAAALWMLTVREEARRAPERR